MCVRACVRVLLHLESPWPGGREFSKRFKGRELACSKLELALFSFGRLQIGTALHDFFALA